MLDEMTAALPTDLVERVLRVVRAQADAGRAVVYISHRFAEIAELCDRATVLRDGATVGDCRDRARGRGPRRRDDARRRADARPPRRPRAARAPPGARASRRGCGSATWPRGRSSRTSRSICTRARCSGVVALEGQGQDELFDVLAGFRRPTGGSIEVEGRRVALPPPRRRHRRGADAGARQSRRRAAGRALGAREHRPAADRGARGTGGRSRCGARASGWRRRSSGCRSTRAPRARCGGCPAATSRR